MPDIQRYGEPGQLEGDYYTVQALGMDGDVSVSVYFIDGLGNTQRVSKARPGAFTREEIAALPTLGEATAMHLGPAFDRAESNQRRWGKEHRNEERTAPKPPTHEATRRFMEDEEGW